VLASGEANPIHARRLRRAARPLPGRWSISSHPRTDRLRIVLDDKYPVVIAETSELLNRCFPQNRVHVGRGSKGKCSSVSVYSTHLICLFPQHGPGLKHARRILLEPWQQDLVYASPWSFLRGCIRSDGSAFINRTDIHRPEPYEYLSYDFANSSDDITRLFTDVCEKLELGPRVSRDRSGRWHVRINRRESVARMLEEVGLKT
jgi:hypothetical protein